MNAQTKISAKGQVVIPKPVRESLCWVEGDALEVVPVSDGVLLRRAQNPQDKITIQQFMAEQPPFVGRPVTVEEMNEAIDRARAERWAAKEARSR